MDLGQLLGFLICHELDFYLACPSAFVLMWLAFVAEFDQTVQESQKEAEQALEKVSQIQEHVTYAENQTAAAIKELGDAENDASRALSLADAAKNRTQLALQVVI